MDWLKKMQQENERAFESMRNGECGCHKCSKERNELGARMIVCPVCGNKRCPKATNHEFACTGSNEPGQKGSIYE